MPVQVWIGDKPEHPNERRAIMALASGLQRMEGLYLILANFSVGGRSIDLVIIKHDAIFILELKHCDGRVIGSVNGPWLVEGRNGERKRLNPGRKNPYNQVISYFHALTNFLNEHRRTFLSAQKANDIDFRTCKRAVVIAPSIQPDSTIELDWKVDLKGLDELPAFLITERSSEIALSDEEMLAIPQLLHCTPWHELNLVLQGVVPDPAAMADPLEPPLAAPTALVTAAAEVAVAPATSQASTGPAQAEAAPALPASGGLIARTRGLLVSRARWAISGVALLTVLVLALLFWRPSVVPPLADQPAALGEVNGLPTGEALTSLGAPTAASCNWSGYQLVGKRYDPASRSWTSVAEGEAGLTMPEVVVALEQVSTCDGKIALTWSLQNNSDRPIEFPLQGTNIRISDGLGNEYALDDRASQPSAIRAAPGAQERGTSVVSRPLSSSASSLLVRIKEQPFGEASFVVALPR